jgi:hypothetical protein
MREYTGNRVFQALRGGYAANPDASNMPLEPPIDEYNRGAQVLTTLPAPYWNWFISSISNNDPRIADAFDDLYRAIDAIMMNAGQSYTDDASDLMTALTTLWQRDTSAVQNNLDYETSRLDHRVDGVIDTTIPAAIDGFSPDRRLLDG